jgi:hypothetical protein
MLEFLVWSSWFVLAGYLVWFVFKARTIQPLSLDELALTWKLHERESGCKAPVINELLIKNNEVVGFKCHCGYMFLQKRLITQRVYKRPNYSLPKTPKPTHPSEANDRLRNLGLRCLHTKEI